ncbi:hypothetical protein IWX46DRAFT_627133 [Phyllosticta citricarpa]|uniref:Uncharacterized protein n=1 Tax=Phyllosticta citricarpa TaxID=55181 RepID=A0ABR1MCJ6_9PEZI
MYSKSHPSPPPALESARGRLAEEARPPFLYALSPSQPASGSVSEPSAPSAPSPAQPSPAYPHATAVQYGAKYLPHLPSSYLYTPVCTTYDIDAAREFDFTRTLRDAAGVCGWKMEDGRCVEWIKCRAAAAYPPVRPPARPPACTPARADGGCGGNWGMEGEGFVCHREDGLDMRGWKDGEVAMYVDEVSGGMSRSEEKRRGMELVVPFDLPTYLIRHTDQRGGFGTGSQPASQPASAASCPMPGDGRGRGSIRNNDRVTWSRRKVGRPSNILPFGMDGGVCT